MDHETIPIFPDFKMFSSKDRNLIYGFLDQYDQVSCEYNFFNLFCWQKEYGLCFCLYKDRLLILDKKGIVTKKHAGFEPVIVEKNLLRLLSAQ